MKGHTRPSLASQKIPEISVTRAKITENKKR